MRDSDGALPAGLQVARSWAVLQRAGALPWTAELAEPRLGPAWSEPLPRLPRQRVALCSWASVPSCAV